MGIERAGLDDSNETEEEEEEYEDQYGGGADDKVGSDIGGGRKGKGGIDNGGNGSNDKAARAVAKEAMAVTATRAASEITAMLVAKCH